MQGMPPPGDLRLSVHDGWTSVMVGCRVVAGHRSDDIGMRNIAVVTLTELGFAGVRVAEVMRLSPEYVSTLRGRARREGSAGLVRPRGRPAKLTAAQVRQARVLQAEGLSNVEIAGRLKVSDKTAARVLPAVPARSAGRDQARLDVGAGLGAEAEAADAADAEAEAEAADADAEAEADADAEVAEAASPVVAGSAAV